MYKDQFQVVNKPIFFSNAIEAQEYAKKNPGVTVKRVKYNNQFQKKYTPKSILEHLNKSVIAQDEAKKEIAIALYYHYKKIKYKNILQMLPSDPIMLIGPTGSGKTFIISQACEYLKILFIHVDTSSMVSEGIIGYNIGKLAADILKKAEFNIEKAEYCVVFFDEIDKLFHPDRDKYGLEVSHQLLRFIEGTTVNISKQDIDGKNEHKLNTHNMQFILGGAFQWIIDKKESNSLKDMGFLKNSLSEQKENKKITLDDLYNENVSKELLGRMHTIINLYSLTKDDYYQILTKSSKSPLVEFKKKITMHGDYVMVDDDVIQAIAKYAAESELGVRSIKQILKKLFSNVLFLAPEYGQRTHHIKYDEKDFNE